VSAIEEQQLERRGRADAPVYVYGIVRAGAGVPRVPGVLGSSVAVVPERQVAALVSVVADERVRAKRRDLLAHSDVLQEAHGGGVVLPLRFGTLFPSEEELRAGFLGPRHDELRSLLDRFEGLGEMRLRASYHDEQSVLGEIVAEDQQVARLREATRTGAASHAQLVRLGELVAARLEARRAADGDEIVRRLSEGAVDVNVDAPEGDLGVVKASFLVREQDRRRFDELLEATALRLRHLVDFTCTGPLPPHSFVAIAGGR